MSINNPSVRTAVRIGGVAAGTGLLLALSALIPTGMAFAHVTAHTPEPAVKGSYAKIVFRVPNEEDGPKTVKLELDLPTDTPLASVYTEPIPGWTAIVTKSQLPHPVKLAKQTVNEAATKIVWTAAGGGGIAAGEFQEFSISAGAIPDNTDRLVIPAIQTYDDGTVVRWDAPQPAPGAAEPEHPAPTVQLAANAQQSAVGTDTGPDTGAVSGTTGAAGSDGSADDTARWLGGAGLVVGALGFAVGGAALLRRRSAGPT